MKKVKYEIGYDLFSLIPAGVVFYQSTRSIR